MLGLKNIKVNIFHKSKKTKIVTKLIEEMAEAQKELLKGRRVRAIQELGDVKAMIKLFEKAFDCKDGVKKATKASLEKWKGLL